MLPCGVRNVNYNQQLAIFRTPLQWALLVAAIILAYLVPLFGNSYLMTFLVYLGITIVSALGLQLLSGYCGQFSMGHAAFMMVGAFTAANLTAGGMHFLLAMVCGGLAAAGTGIIFGLPSKKVKEFYLVLSTIAAQFIITYAIVGWFKGDVGIHIRPVQIAGWSLAQPSNYWYLVLTVLIIVTFAAKNIARTKVGRAFVAIRDNDIAAEAMGINIYAYKLLAFAVGCFYAGIAGALWAGFVNFATVDHYQLFDSIWYLAIVFVGGIGSITGVFLGAIFIRGVRELAYIVSPMVGNLFPPGHALGEGITLSLPYMLFGVILALFIVYEPRGLAHRWEILKTSGRLWPWAYW
jgi:branched-chain amino acid transport system permease protein